MRILKVHNFYTQSGGEDTVFMAETALLRSRGYEVEEYLEYNDKIFGMNRASVVAQTLWSYSSYQRLKHVLREVKPDLVHFHNTFPLISPSAYYACQDLSIPVVQTLDNQRLICPAASFYRNGKLCLECIGKTPPLPSVLNACYHGSHLHTAVVASMLTLHRLLRTWQTKIDIFFCSTFFYRDLFLQAGFPEDKLVVMPHFVARTDVRENRYKKKSYAVFIGRLSPEKGIANLLKAWQVVDIPLKIRGSGQLEEWAKTFVLQNNMRHVEFVEKMSESELSDLIAGASFLIMPSEGYYETFGMVIIEAYSRGVPVIASDIGVAPELVADKHTGLLFEVGDPQNLADKASWLWNHPVEAEEMGRNGFDLCQEKYTQDQCFKILTGTYKALIRK